MRLIAFFGLVRWFGLYAYHYGGRVESAMPDHTRPWLEHCSDPLDILLNIVDGRSASGAACDSRGLPLMLADRPYLTRFPQGEASPAGGARSSAGASSTVAEERR